MGIRETSCRKKCSFDAGVSYLLCVRALSLISGVHVMAKGNSGKDHEQMCEFNMVLYLSLT